MITQINYDEYHKLYGDHLMADVDILPEFRIIEVETYDRDVLWFKTEKQMFALIDLAIIGKPIKTILIT